MADLFDMTLILIFFFWVFCFLPILTILYVFMLFRVFWMIIHTCHYLIGVKDVYYSSVVFILKLFSVQFSQKCH